jgi:hypothetical protein
MSYGISVTEPIRRFAQQQEMERRRLRERTSLNPGRQPVKIDPATLPGDLDGQGSPPDIFQSGPTPSMPTVTISDQVRSMSGPEASVSLEPQLDRMQRDQTRQAIGAFPADQGEAQQAVARKRGLKMRDGEAPKATRAPEQIPAPRPQQGGVTFIGEPSPGDTMAGTSPQVSVRKNPQMQAMDQYRSLKDQYQRGVAKGDSFVDVVNQYAEDNPESPLSGQMPELTRGPLSPMRVSEDEAEATQIAAARENRRQSIKRAQFTRELLNSGPALLFQTIDANNQKMQELRARSESGAISPDDLMLIAETSNSNAAAYMAAHYAHPGRGFDVLAAESLKGIDRALQQAVSLQNTGATTAMAMAGAAPNLTPPKDPPVAQQLAGQIQAANQSVDPAGALAEYASATNPGADESVLRQRRDQLNQMAAVYGLKDFLDAGGRIDANAMQVPAISALGPLAKTLDRRAFVLRIAPALGSAYPDPAQRMAAATLIYDMIRNSRSHSWGR